jgi:hypothetical protein
MATRQSHYNNILIGKMIRESSDRGKTMMGNQCTWFEAEEADG